MASELICTCGDGGQASGNKQEIIEKRMSDAYGLTVQEIHALLDLMVDVLGAVIDLPEVEPGETERRMAEQSGRPVKWIEGFLVDWEALADELDRMEWWKLPECSTPSPDCS